MKTITHPQFLFLASINLVYYSLKQTDVVFPELISNYLADLLRIFLINTVILFIIRKLKNKPRFELPSILVWIGILMATVFLNLYWHNKNPFTFMIRGILCTNTLAE